MHKYHTHAYIVNSTNTTVLHDLGDYYIVIMGYSGGAMSDVNEATYINALSQYLEDYSKFGGTVLAPDGFSSVSNIYETVFPALEPKYCTITSNERTGKVKLVFDSGDYILGDSYNLGDSNANLTGEAYESDGTVLYSTVLYPGLVNGLYPSNKTDGSPQFLAVRPEKFTENGFDASRTITQYEFYWTHVPGWSSEGTVTTSTTNTDFFRFLNRQTPQPLGFSVTYDLQGCVSGATNPTIIPPNATITNFDFTPDTDYSFVFNSVYIDGDGFPSGTPIAYEWDPDTGHLKIGPITSDITIHVHAYIDPYSDLPVDGETDIPGGDLIPTPSLPGLGAVSAGVIGLFAPSPSQMQALANYMWTDFGGTGTTVEDILSEIVEALKRSIANPLDYVVGLNIIPSQGLSIGSDRAIRFGFTNSGISLPQLTSQYFVVDCGTLRFDALCGDTFLDYAPYSKFSIYLPYVGIKEVDANDFVGHTIGVIYHGDVVTGGVTAYITKDGSVIYQYSGCCALNVPLNADGWGSTIAGAVQIATSLVAGGFAGGAAGVAESAVKGAAAAAANPSLLSPKVQHSGAVSGGAGCMGVQTPFVIREAVRFHSTAGMNTISGYPSFYYKSLGSVSGYTVVLDVHLHGIPATSQEIVEIETLLKSGVIL